MIVCVAGDVHGALNRLYTDVAAFEQHLGVSFAWILQVGDFGVWPNPFRVDRATRKRGHGDFADWWLNRKPAPKQTLFIQGNHEDFGWLVTQPTREILRGVHWLPNGMTFDLGGIVVGGVSVPLSPCRPAPIRRAALAGSSNTESKTRRCTMMVARVCSRVKTFRVGVRNHE